MDELENLAPIPRYSCSTPTKTCTCDLIERIVNYEKKIKLSQYLIGRIIITSWNVTTVTCLDTLEINVLPYNISRLAPRLWQAKIKAACCFY